MIIDKPIKLILKGWIEEGEEYTNVPKRCPKCGSRLYKTNVLQLCNILWVGCKDARCRWSAEYEI